MSTTNEQSGPVPGDTFVWMEARPGEWDETTETVTEVVGPDPDWEGAWLVAYVLPPIPRDTIPPVFGKYREEWQKPSRRLLCGVVRGEDGRWHADYDEEGAPLSGEPF